MKLLKHITTISSVIAVFCVVALPFWIFGVPGIEGDYAKGWSMGLTAIIRFPIFWLIILIISTILKTFYKKRIRQIEIVVHSLLLLLILWLLVTLFFAFSTM